MSKIPALGSQDVRIDMVSRQTVYKTSKQPQEDFVYVNPAYVGSVDSVNNRISEPPTSVIREQYCVCSRWPFAQRVLAAAVGLLVGAVIGLAVTVAMRGDEDGIAGIFRHSAPD